MIRRLFVIAGLAAAALPAVARAAPDAASAAKLDIEHAMHYSLVTSRIGKHRLSLRYEDFFVVEDDINPRDDAPDSGRVWMLAYRYHHTPRWSIGVEWLKVASWHPAWRYFNPASRETERLVQIHLSVRPGAARQVSSNRPQTASTAPAERFRARARAFP